MADPEVRDELATREREPEASVEREQDLTQLEAPTPDSPDAVEPDAPDEAPDEAPPPEPENILEREDVKTAIEKAAADARVEAREAEQLRISMEAGADSRVVEAVDSVLTAMGVSTQDLTNPQKTTMRAAFASQGQFQAYEQAKTLAASMIERYQIPSETLTRALEFWNAKDPTAFANTITTSVIDSVMAKAKTDWDTERDTEVARLVQGELDARSKQTTNESPPDAPAGVAAGLGPSPQEYGAATPEQRAQWNTDGVEVRIPTA